MGKSIRSLFWILLLGILIAGGYFLYKNLKTAVNLDDITINVTNVSQDTMEVEMSLFVDNPLFFDFSIYDLYYQASLENTLLLDDSTHLDKKISDSTHLTIPVKVNFKKVKNKLDELSDQDSTMLDARVKLHYALPIIGNLSNSFSHSMKIPVPQLASMEIEKVQVNHFGLQNIDLDIKMLINNPNDIEATLDDFIINVSLNESTLVKGLHTDPVKLKGNQQIPFNLPIKIKTESLAKEFIDKVSQGEEIKIFIDGSCMVNIQNLPLDRFRVNFETEGPLNLQR